MTQKDNILQELNELQSSLADTSVQNAYEVPAGYFDDLADQMLRRVKALDATNAGEELGYLSPFLSSISKQMPYAVPSGYFKDLSETIITGDQSPVEELERLSPLLSSLKKEMLYSVPRDYFENFNAVATVKTAEPKAKVISITNQKWFRYAVAAVVIGFVAMIGLLLNNNNSSIDPTTQSAEWVKKNLKKVNPDEIDSFVQMIDEATPTVAINDSKEMNEIKELIKDVPEKEMQEFLDEAQTSVAEEDNGSDMFVN